MADLEYQSHITTALSDAATAINDAQDVLDAALAADPLVPADIAAARVTLAAAQAAAINPGQIYNRHKADVDATNLDAQLARTDAALVTLLRLIVMAEARAGRKTTYAMSQEVRNYAMSGSID
jgi:hypothetical protein